MIENKIVISKSKILFFDKTTKIEKTPESLIIRNRGESEKINNFQKRIRSIINNNGRSF